MGEVDPRNCSAWYQPEKTRIELTSTTPGPKKNRKPVPAFRKIKKEISPNLRERLSIMSAGFP